MKSLEKNAEALYGIDPNNLPAGEAADKDEKMAMVYL